ncbi:Iron(III) dicitrate transport protein FecA [Fulvivirga imtechensis AK7]|uniref:Iron(III) dicitrate transport protein FecA n=1 Tax=Fulvivirga imtechensis AK7 TaxID=1237149 RepID=L8JRJ6_9BACT|nr:TonB-dependent receptor [Fulvivirga imtechensis]ELR71601.1 Iron(III) dicitrate transport protein FecA [Fulvivirga imtechensis AK7]
MKGIKKYIFFTLTLLSSVQVALAQVTISGTVVTDKGEAVEGADVFLQNTAYLTYTDNKGRYKLTNVPYGTYALAVFYMGKATATREIILDEGKMTLLVDFELQDFSTELDNVVIKSEREATTGIRRLQSVEGAAIYEGKKNEVIELNDITANLAVNNSRQVYAKVPGLNIWESDGAGLQLGIGARGLDPSRTANFNVRQNGYDISADALGYPESYYTPSTEALDRIEVVRGAASLQYGTQFGGLLNFVLKEGPEDKKAQVTTRNTVGSYGFLSTFNSVGGTVGAWNYYTFFQYKQGDGWRENSQFDSKMAYASVKYSPSHKLSVKFEYTFMDYLAQQPGGLNDYFFADDPRQSIRGRNWFQVNWNLMANIIDYKINDRLKFNLRNFALLGGRDALGNLGRIDRIDDLEMPRDLFSDDFNNFGSEGRLIYNYTIGRQHAVALVGARYYNGFTDRKQGNADATSEPHFDFRNPDDLEGSDFNLPSENISIFAENIFDITEKFSVTPGARFERIYTGAKGYYKDAILVKDPNTGLAVDSTFNVSESKGRERAFIFFGVGLSYKLKNKELYANFSQNYKSINFNDIRVTNPNLVVDENIKDEFGYNFDLGLRGNKAGKFNYDVSVFYLRYNDRISAIQKKDEVNVRLYRFRGNISDAFSTGIEAFGEADLLDMFGLNNNSQLNLFVNVSAIHAEYLSSNDPAMDKVIAGKKVELVPPLSARTGLSYINKNFKITYQYSYVQEHFTDATNATLDPSAVSGIIPTYYVMDLSASYRYKFAKLEASVNNLTDNHYFTRRASGYPGPGIIPADGRTFYLTLELKL